MKTVYRANNGDMFTSKELCEEYDKFTEILEDPIFMNLSVFKKDTRSDHFQYFLDHDLTITEYHTKNDNWGGRPPLKYSNNIGSIKDIIVNNIDTIQKLYANEIAKETAKCDKEIKQLTDRKNSIMS